MILLGLYTHEKANLAVPQLQSFLTKEPPFISFLAQAKIGILGGVLAGILILAVNKIITPYVSAEYIAMGEKMNPPALTRFLYGGLVEEILIRFGLMSGLVLLFSKITKNLSDTVYWAAIAIAAILFGMGHLPLLFQLNPNPSMGLVGFIIVANSLAGFIFGYLYWKKGLEAAFVAHIFAHVTMLAAAAL
jgi:Type II CAAX prenyl endopeptidase Rce1-like